MNLLENMLDSQRALQEAMGSPMGTGDAAIKENLFALIVEVTEALDEINWKPWRARDKIIDREKLAEELVDVLQFWLNAASAAGLTAPKIAETYYRKLRVCHERIRAQSTRVAPDLDIDHISEN